MTLTPLRTGSAARPKDCNTHRMFFTQLFHEEAGVAHFHEHWLSKLDPRICCNLGGRILKRLRNAADSSGWDARSGTRKPRVRYRALQAHG
jgi:hypothetical protein